MTKLQECAEALCRKHYRDRFPQIAAAHLALNVASNAHHFTEEAREVISVLQRPDMNAVMRTAGQIAMRPSDIDLAVTAYIDAVLKEPQP